MLEKHTLILYHANCPDGFCSAWSARKKFGDNAEYIPVKHGEPPPDVNGKVVYIVDFSYNRTILLEMESAAKSLTVIDHHISAAKELGDLDFCHFDMSHSGAYLTWKYFFGEDNVPSLVRYIEDRDLWSWELDSSKEILSAIDSYPKDFEIWNKISDRLDSGDSKDWLSLKELGVGILRYKDNLISSLMKNSFRLNIAGVEVPAINISFFQSEIASAMAEGEEFAAAYYYSGEGYRFSLRSAKNGADVSKIASHFGGGGHKNAAGFEVGSLGELTGTNGRQKTRKDCP